ncbi:hypothetical protein TNCV_618121 [Trichonephila clavipes]|nr:hypothetical protein TNCV_618121 [Trichonephila clavipes]
MEETHAAAEKFRLHTRALIPNYDKDFVLNTDQTDDKGIPTCTMKVIPPKCTTPLVQPCDVYFYRQVKNFCQETTELRLHYRTG